MPNTNTLTWADMMSDSDEELVIVPEQVQVSSIQFTPPECLCEVSWRYGNLVHFYSPGEHSEYKDGSWVEVEYTCKADDVFIILRGCFNYYFDHDCVFVERRFIMDEQYAEVWPN